MRRTLTLLLALLALVAPVVTPRARAQEPGDGASRWPRGPGPLPIGVWLQDPALAERYRSLGIELFVGLWKGPTDDQLDRLAAAGMRTVCAPNEVARGRLDDPTIAGWLLFDEPDNRAEGRPGPRATPAELLTRYERIRASDPTRPVLLNLGQGVANDGWKGLGADRSSYPDYAQACDVLSFDVYPVANTGPGGEERLWWIAKGVRRLRAWAGPERPVWCFVETTAIHHPERAPSPRHVRAEVWLALVAGARGIVYFAHRFEPELDPAALLHDAEMARAVAALNREVRELTPALLAPEPDDLLPVESEGAPVATLHRRHAGDLLLVVVGLRNAPARVRIGLPADVAGSAATVIGEDRSIRLEDGVLADELEPWDVRLYRMPLREPR